MKIDNSEYEVDSMMYELDDHKFTKSVWKNEVVLFLF
jgi:hypothetical protein